jgi:hypothetical protein
MKKYIDIDLLGSQEGLTKAEEEMLSDFIKKQNQTIKKKSPKRKTSKQKSKA